jgi:hypothetical protein
MPNGHDLSDEDFSLLLGPLLRVDALFETFANRIGGKIVHNYHDSPSRQIRLSSERGLRKSIGLFPFWLHPRAVGAERELRYLLDIAAYWDTESARTSWVEEIAQFLPEQVRPETVAPLLDRAWERLAPIDGSFVQTHGRQTPRPSP